MAIFQPNRTKQSDPDHRIDVYQRSAPMRLTDFAFAVHQLQTIAVPSRTIDASAPRLIYSKALVYMRPTLAARNLSLVHTVVPQVLQRFENSTGLWPTASVAIVLVPNVRSDWTKVVHGLIFIR